MKWDVDALYRAARSSRVKAAGDSSMRKSVPGRESIEKDHTAAYRG